ncbi:MAG: WYL domain-containing protein [SAR324 cluster bacterium]|nr:WYL domain-containing protein [SAR324 cluster bacterium]
MADSTLRQWTILKVIPREPRSITIEELKTLLDQRGIEASSRTIHRDLTQLSLIFPFTSKDKKGKASKWFWPIDMGVFDLPGMELETAFAFSMAESFLTQTIPSGLSGQLQPYFKHARNLMNQEILGGLKNWDKKVRFLPKGQQFLMPEIKPQVKDRVFESLMKEKKLRIRYKRPWQKEGEERVVSPVGLVFRNEITYLVATYKKEDNPIQLVLSRIEEAEVLPEIVKHPKGVDLDSYLESGEFSYPTNKGKTIRLKVLLDPNIEFILRETPISKDQKLTEDEDDWWLLEATVEDTQELRWWIQSFGAEMIIQAPKALREEFAENWKWLAMEYQK